MNLQYSRKNPVRVLVGLGFIAVFTLMTMVTWLSMSSLHDVNTSMSELIESTSQKSTHAYRLRDLIRLRSNTIRTLTYSQDSEERHIIFDKLAAYTESYESARQELKSLEANSREREILDQIDKAYSRVQQGIDAANQQVSTDSTGLDARLHELELQELVLLNQLNKLVTLEKNLAEEALHDNQTTYSNTRRLLLIMVIASFTFAVMISVTIIARVTKYNKQISHLADHDDLTGLYNRRYFEEHLQHTIDVVAHTPTSHGLFYIDLDRFKMINDTCGHQAGDQLLIELTELINSRLHAKDLFARLGGDEFAIIAQGKTFEDIRALSEELRELISDFIFTFETYSFDVSMSVGVTHIDGLVQDIEQVLADVDAACYIAKKSGRNRVHVKQDNDANLAPVRSNIADIQAVREALNDERPALFYQPVYNVGSDLTTMACCEILLSIQNETGELYSPLGEISNAEKDQITTDIDRWLFSHVIDWLVVTQRSHVIPRLLIHISGHAFSDAKFSEFVITKLQQEDVDPTRIAFEISEASIVSNYEQLQKFSIRIKALGGELALADFGSGHANFTHLKNLAFDYLKIDRSLVRNIASNTADKNMVSAINQMGHTIGAKTIAEFVDSDEDMQCLKELNVDFTLGFGQRMVTPLGDLIDNIPMRAALSSAQIMDGTAANSTFSNTIPDGMFKKAS